MFDIQASTLLSPRLAVQCQTTCWADTHAAMQKAPAQTGMHVGMKPGRPASHDSLNDRDLQSSHSPRIHCWQSIRGAQSVFDREYTGSIWATTHQAKGEGSYQCSKQHVQDTTTSHVALRERGGTMGAHACMSVTFNNVHTCRIQVKLVSYEHSVDMHACLSPQQ